MRVNRQNQLLAALSPLRRSRIEAYAEHVVLSPGDVIADAGDRPQWAFFPETGVISLLAMAREGSMEAGLVGSEGMIGMALILGGRGEVARAVVQVEALGWREPADALITEFRRGGQLTRNLFCYTETLVRFVAHAAACNGAHNPEQRFARWLLAVSRRVRTPVLPLAAANLGDVLGVSGEVVWRLRSSLVARHVIETVGPNLRITDRRRLRAVACACDRTDAQELVQLRRALTEGTHM